METSTVAVREAATVMLVRDAPDFEVFMVRRSPRSSFVPDAYVFPGGQVDDSDGATDLLERCTGVDADIADRRLGTSGAMRFYVAALRESFEEAGVLVARGLDDGAAMTPSLDLAADRRRLLRGQCDIAAVLDTHGAVFDVGALVPFARWIGPLGAPQRFDAWYFVARAPEGHAYVHDDHELVASDWVRPADMVERAVTGSVKVPYPTLQTLRAMCDASSANALLEAADACWLRPEPWREVKPGRGWVLDLGPDAVERGARCRT